MPEESVEPHRPTSIRYQMTLDYLVGALLAYIYEQMRLGESGEDIDIVAVHGFFAEALYRQGFTPESLPDVSFEDAYEWRDGRLQSREIERHELEYLSGEELFRRVFPGGMTAQVYLDMLDYTDTCDTTDGATTDRTIGEYLINRIYRLTPIDAIRIRVIRRMIGLSQIDETDIQKEKSSEKFPIEPPSSIL